MAPPPVWRRAWKFRVFDVAAYAREGARVRKNRGRMSKERMVRRRERESFGRHSKADRTAEVRGMRKVWGTVVLSFTIWFVCKVFILEHSILRETLLNSSCFYFTSLKQGYNQKMCAMNSMHFAFYILKIRSFIYYYLPVTAGVPVLKL